MPQDAIKKEQALQKVLSRVPVESSRDVSSRHAAIASAMRVPPWTVGLYLSKLRASSLTMDSRALSLTAQITRLIRQVWRRFAALRLHAAPQLAHSMTSGH